MTTKQRAQDLCNRLSRQYATYTRTNAYDRAKTIAGRIRRVWKWVLEHRFDEQTKTFSLS